MVRSALRTLGLLLAVISANATAGEMRPPRLSFAQIDWSAAAGALVDVDALRPAARSGRLRLSSLGPARPGSSALGRLNAIMAQRFTGVATSPVPVLLPFDTEALLRDLAAGTASNDNDRYLSGFDPINFFYPGPAGYDAAFSIMAHEVPDIVDSKYKDPIIIQMSGSALLYELDWPTADRGTPVPALEASFPGIRRQILEHHLRYTFVRFGVPYVVSVLCFDSSVSRYRMPTCRNAERVALHFLRSLRLVGGTPQKLRTAGPVPTERPAEVSSTFAFYGAGNLVSGTGRADQTVYSQIRFPLAAAPAFAKSQVYYNPSHTVAAEAGAPAVSVDPWRDNFCESRGFPVGQCPAGIGHQGQDIRPGRCTPPPGADRCERHDDVVAVRGGVILRSPSQEAVYLFVNSASEHIRFRYLHMNPRKMDQDNLLSGRRVYEGEVIGQVSNFSRRANGTSYHLHFDVQVPTKDGWVFVNPYMTLVAAYERLIGARGIELGGPLLAASDRSVLRATRAIGRSALAVAATVVAGPATGSVPASIPVTFVAAKPATASATPATTAAAGDTSRIESRKARKKHAKRHRLKLKKQHIIQASR
jgi:hypothetical protein